MSDRERALFFAEKSLEELSEVVARMEDHLKRKDDRKYWKGYREALDMASNLLYEMRDPD
jgi:hypothetical protein